MIVVFVLTVDHRQSAIIADVTLILIITTAKALAANVANMILFAIHGTLGNYGSAYVAEVVVIGIYTEI
jgi:hypothetical protein